MTDDIADRNRAFETDDVAWVSRRFSQATDKKVIEAAFHKVRYACLGVSEAKRRESQAWLADRRLGDMVGGPVSKTDPLP